MALAEQIQSWVSDELTAKGHMVLHVISTVPTPDEPLLEIEVGNENILRLEPASFAADQLPTSVHLYAYPTLRRVVLVGPNDKNEWDIQTSEGVALNYGWNKADFIKLLRNLAEPYVARSV